MSCADEMMSLCRSLAMLVLVGGALAAPSVPAEARAQGRPSFGGFRGPAAPAFRGPAFGAPGVRPPGFYPGYRGPYWGGGWGYRPSYGWGYGGYPYWGWAPFGLGLGLGLAWAWPWYAASTYPAYPAYPGYPAYGYPPPYAQPAYPYGTVEPSYSPGMVAPAAPPAPVTSRSRGANAAICQAGPVTCGLPNAVGSGQPCSCPSPAGAVWGFAQ